MKSHVLLSSLLAVCLFVCIGAGLSGNGAYANTINVPAARTLSTVLTQIQKDTITILKLTGFLEGASSNYDLGVLRNDMPNLQYLDISEVTMMNNTTPNNSIPSSAFSGKTGLKSIILPTKVTVIGSSAFDGCTSLSQVVLPDSLLTISNTYAFRNCTSLNAIQFPSNLQTIGNNSFQNCVSLTTVLFPASLQTIGSSAFNGCSGVTSIQFSEGLQSMGNDAFRACTSLVALQLPASLQAVSNNAFRECSGLTSVQFPEGLQDVGNASFYDCSRLGDQLALPSTITTIQSNAFGNCHKLRSCKILAEEPPSVGNSSALNNIFTVFVPPTAIQVYQGTNFWSGKNIVASEQLNTVDLNITTPGELGAKAIALHGYLNRVHVLKLSGALNSTDFNNIKDMVNLVSVDLSGLTNTELANELFRGRRGLLDVKLPANLQKISYACFYDCVALEDPVFPASVEEIGDHAFTYCYNFLALDLPMSLKYIRNSNAFYECINIKTINFPNGLLEIGNGAFNRCYSLTEIDIPESITSIGSSAFQECSSLSSAYLPDHLTVINGYTFYGCSSLAGIILPSKLTTLGDAVFAYCNKLTNITLPAGLVDMRRSSRIFQSCTGLQQVICLQSTPPVVDQYDQFNGITKASCELLVPNWALSEYKLAESWKLFPVINGYNEEIDQIVVNGSLTMSNSMRPLGLPCVDITRNGNLTVRGSSPFNANGFTLRPHIRYMLNENYSFDYTYFSQFISECSNMSAQQVKIDMNMAGNRWYHLSLPFDVAINDITIDEDAYFVFRRYDGQTRAAQGTGNSWKNMTTGDTLRMGEGYIFQCNKNVSHLVLPATEPSKNKLFQPTDKTFTLNEFTAESASNSSWNLVGNPSASYFDVQFLDFTAPVTYWNDYYSRYEAISPVDDAFLVRPYQAFFVQKPTDLGSITFLSAGRQTTTEIVQRAPALRTSSGRTLINLELNGSENGDKTRVVINSDANLEYDLKSDASKFMSTETLIPQLYSLDASNTQYAINERPLDDGIVALGYYAGAADRLVISLKNMVDGYSIGLKDKYMDLIFNLSSGDYTFNSEAGTFNDRFVLQIAKSTGEITGIDTTNPAATKVYTSGKNIAIETDAAGKTITVYTTAGITVAETKSTSSSTIIPVTQGVYIVRVGGEVFKVVVF